MNRILEYLEGLSWRGKTVQKADAGMKAGEVWSYPLKLDKGIDYLIKTKGCENVKGITCLLTKGYDPLTLHKETGPAPSFYFTPETDGVYRLHLSLDSTQNPRSPGAVGVTLLKERVPPRAVIGMFGWPQQRVAQSLH